MSHVTRASHLLAWAAVAVTALLAVLNWQTLMLAAPLNLGVMQIDAPLGVVLLGLGAAVAILFFVAYLRAQLAALRETRRLLKELQRLQDLADRAEASRLHGLNELLANGFRRLDGRLDALAPTPSATSRRAA